MSQPIVAAIQMTSLADVGRNLDTARRLLRDARDRGACLAVLPENFSFMGRNEAERRAVVERDGDGPAQSAVAAMAREFGMWVVAGTQPIAVPGDPRPANVCMVYDDKGGRAARYDKIHLFDVDLPGERVEVIGDGQHFQAVVVSPAFAGKSRVQRHQLVYKALGDRMRVEIHALSMQTLTPEEAKQNG